MPGMRNGLGKLLPPEAVRQPSTDDRQTAFSVHELDRHGLLHEAGFDAALEKRRTAWRPRSP